MFFSFGLSNFWVGAWFPFDEGQSIGQKDERREKGRGKADPFQSNRLLILINESVGGQEEIDFHHFFCGKAEKLSVYQSFLYHQGISIMFLIASMYTFNQNKPSGA